MIKKIITTAVISTALLMGANKMANADMSNPVNQALVQDGVKNAGIVIEGNKACGNAEYIPTLSKMRTFYINAFAVDEMDTSLIDMYISTGLSEVYHGQHYKTFRQIKKFRNHPETVKACKKLSEKAIEIQSHWN